MGGLLACWVVFPLLLGVLAYGCGGLVERAAGRTLTLAVRLPCGVALVIGVLDLLTDWTATVHLAVPAVVALAVAGLLSRRVWRVRRFDRAVVAAGTIVFAVYAAPIVLSGAATWAGYVKLDDTATWLALADRTLTAGHTLAGLGPSTYKETLAAYLTNGYPVGSFLPFGLGHELLGQDSAWLTDPWMAFTAAMLALSLQRIAGLALGARAGGARPAIVAVLAAQPALLYGYYLWGGIKEMTGAMLVAAFAAALPLAFEGRRRVRALIPALVVVWAMIAALSTGGLVWVAPGGLIALALLFVRRGVRLPSPRAVLAAAVVCGVGAYLALRPGGFVEKYQGVLTGGNELGNLLGPLRLRQIAGIWPVGDFRLTPASPTVANALIVLAVVLAAGGLALALRRSARGLVLYALCALVGALIVFAAGSPWIAGKALASASPAIPLLALTACMALAAGAHRARAALGVIAALAIAVGIVWSNVLAYHDASLAPRAQFTELAAIGARIAGQGPTLMTDYSPYGARHFLREAEPESASELRSRLDPLLSGQPLPRGGTAAIDQFPLSTVLVYRTLVLRRSPADSRPPSPYSLILRDRYWEVWQRPRVVRAPVLAQTPLGDVTQPGGVPSCAAVARLARTPGAARLVAVPVQNPLVIGAGEGTHPRRWSDGAELLTLDGPGRARLRVTVARAGRYAVWLGGSMAGPVTIAINGSPIATVRYEIQEDAAYVPFGEVGLERGAYNVEIDYPGGDWRPGSGGPLASVGPLVLAPEPNRQSMISVAPADARSLCGRTLEWVEAVGAGGTS